MDQTPPQRAEPVNRPPNTKFVVGGAVVVVAIAALIVWALAQEGATPFYLKTSELVSRGAPATAEEEYRVNGNVVPGSVERAGLATTFSITDGATELTVTTDQPLPDAFRDDARTEVVAQGTYNGRLFSASQVLAKCPSKFKAKA